MNCTALISSIIVGLLTSGIVAALFYRFGRTDTTKLFRRTVLTFAVLRLKEMTPTSQERVAHGYGLRDTAHFFTCLAEVLAEIGFEEDAQCLSSVIAEMKVSPDIPNPDERQKEAGETAKKVWEQKIHERISKLR